MPSLPSRTEVYRRSTSTVFCSGYALRPLPIAVAALARPSAPITGPERPLGGTNSHVSFSRETIRSIVSEIRAAAR
jgi:hypothetical protein